MTEEWEIRAKFCVAKRTAHIEAAEYLSNLLHRQFEPAVIQWLEFCRNQARVIDPDAA